MRESVRNVLTAETMVQRGLRSFETATTFHGRAHVQYRIYGAAGHSTRPYDLVKKHLDAVMETWTAFLTQLRVLKSPRLS
ncbi:hypothetical protein Ae201684P_010814 [Aphanomyces euteiches]|nr:hypothetical protein Ae201684P_010814 [Aphanomyces euteiches]